MAQAILPLIPEGTTPITDIISVRKEDGKWYYFFGVNPVFSHAESDRRSFQMFTSQLVCQGQCKQVDMQRVFGTSMMEDFGIDKLCEYGTEEIPGLQAVVNPEWRKLDSRCRSLKGKLVYRTPKFGALTLHPELEPKRYETWAKRKAKPVEEIQQYERELEEATAKRKSIPKHISVDELPEGEKFERLAPGRKHLVDTIKMIAHRAETAMAMILREDLGRPDD